VLKLIAQRVPTQGLDSRGKPVMYNCRSGLVTTYPGLRFKYGYIQIVARIPEAYGLWPALWLAGANWKWPPEIDILEHWGRNPVSGLFLHPVGGRRVARRVHTANLSIGWHTFGLLWSSTELVWSIDGRKLLTVRSHIPNIPMYLIANVAEARRPKTHSGCEGTMYIQSVKVWQRK
jgi:beta-glucanase (GH16 family)